MKTSTYEGIKDHVIPNTESHRRKKSKTSKRSGSRDCSKPQQENSKLSFKNEILSKFTQELSFSHWSYAKHVRVERTSHFYTVISPKMIFGYLGISKELINSFKNKLNKCATDNIPEYFTVQGNVNEKVMMLYDYANSDQSTSDSFINDIMITQPNKNDVTGIFERNLLNNWYKKLRHIYKNSIETVWIKEIIEDNDIIYLTRAPIPSDYQLLLPELRMESTQSHEREREYYHTKINVYWAYANCSFEVYPIKSMNLSNTPLARVLIERK